jgi:hypothetical protein
MHPTPGDVNKSPARRMAPLDHSGPNRGSSKEPEKQKPEGNDRDHARAPKSAGGLARLRADRRPARGGAHPPGAQMPSCSIKEAKKIGAAAPRLRRDLARADRAAASIKYPGLRLFRSGF